MNEKVNRGGFPAIAAIIIAACLLLGYGIGSIIGTMKKNNDERKTCIGPVTQMPSMGTMTPEDMLSLGRLSDPQLSPDGSKVIYGVSYTSLEENRSCRNIFMSNIDGSGKVQLTKSESSISCARWSPDGSSVYFLRGGQLWNARLHGLKLGKAHLLSDVPAGISEFKISPDGANILYISSIPGPVKTPSSFDPALDKASAYVTEDLMYRHWDHWVTETPRTFVAPLNGRKITAENSFDLLGDEPYELPTEPFGGAEQLSWSPDGRFIAYSCRKKTGKEYAFSTDTEIYLYDIASGQTVVIPMGGGYDTDPIWSPNGRHLAWISMARDGYEADKQRLMVCDIDGLSFSGIRELTADFLYDAASPVWTPDGTGIYFQALADGTQKLFLASLDDIAAGSASAGSAAGSGASADIRQLTTDDWMYDFFSPWGIVERDGRTVLLCSYYCLNFPTELVAVDLSEPSFCQITHENDALLAQVDGITQEKRMIRTVDGKEMLTWVLYPPHFDPSKVYPSILITLGGPQGSISQDWSYRWCYRLMAQQGFIVVLPNRRGTTAFGQEWKEQISGDYIGLNMQDYLCAAKALKAEPYVGKMAACGASYGGYSVYYLAGIHGDVFDAFIAHAGIFDEKYMWFTTEEMWFPNWDNGGLGQGEVIAGIRQGGAPYSSQPKAVRHYTNSPDLNVRNWHTPILCIHGGKDFRIPYDQGMAAFNAAQMMGVPSKLVVFPEENHWILQPQNALFWHRTFFDWLNQWLKD